MTSTKIQPELIQWRERIEGYARDAGLDFYPVIFEVLDWKQMNMVASYGGFPNRYPHWRFGMEYEQLAKSYGYGLSKIYEMVINNDPCYAYLLHSNNLVDQKLVMAHVYGHCDFFKNNVYFGHTSRKMMDEMANHKTKIKRYIDRFGLDAVEKFLDVCLSVENLIDHHGTFIKRRREHEEVLLDDEDEEKIQVVTKLKSKDYMDKYINPREFLDAQKKKIKDEKDQERKFPENPERDILLFLLEYSPLDPWKRDILSMIREEAYYFLPQMQTKIMNEGWASYWHSTIMTTKALTPDEVIDYADHHSGTLAPYSGRLNPYKLGIELFRDIEERWNKGKFGKDYDECEDMVEKKRWNRNLGLGRQKIFEVRKLYNDLTFIDTFLTPEFCAEHKYFTYDFNKNNNTYEIASRQFKKIKERFLFTLTNAGQPILAVTEANYRNRGELYITHQHEGVDLKLDWLQEVLKSLYELWTRPVFVDTKVEGVGKIFSFDGTEQQEIRKEG